MEDLILIPQPSKRYHNFKTGKENMEAGKHRPKIKKIKTTYKTNNYPECSPDIDSYNGTCESDDTDTECEVLRCEEVSLAKKAGGRNEELEVSAGKKPEVLSQEEEVSLSEKSGCKNEVLEVSEGKKSEVLRCEEEPLSKKSGGRSEVLEVLVGKKPEVLSREEEEVSVAKTSDGREAHQFRKRKHSDIASDSDDDIKLICKVVKKIDDNKCGPNTSGEFDHGPSGEDNKVSVLFSSFFKLFS